MTEIERLKQKRADVKVALENYEYQVVGCRGALAVLDDLIASLEAEAAPKDVAVAAGDDDPRDH